LTNAQIVYNDVRSSFTATWSVEAIVDLEAQYNIDAAAILADIIIAELTAEIDSEIINDLVTVTATDTRAAEIRDLYFSEESYADVLAWTGGGVLGHGPIRTRTIEKINWKKEGF
jgi:hypothetical protein